MRFAPSPCERRNRVALRHTRQARMAVQAAAALPLLDDPRERVVVYNTASGAKYA